MHHHRTFRQGNRVSELKISRMLLGDSEGNRDLLGS